MPRANEGGGFGRALVARLPLSWIKRVAAWQFSSPAGRRLVGLFGGWLRRRDGRVARGVGAGLRFNPGGANLGYVLGTTEPVVQDVLARYLGPGQTFYDVGANVGFFTAIAARLVGPDGEVVSFEPFPENVEALRHNLALNGFAHVTVVAKAVSSARGQGELLLAEDPTWAKLAQTGARPDTVGAIPVELVSLDEFLAEGKAKPQIWWTALEGDLPLAEARWDVHALALPRERRAAAGTP